MFRVKSRFPEETKFIDVPESVLQTPVAKQITVPKKDIGASRNWWDEKINLPATQISRRAKRIEHDQLLLSDLDSHF